MGGWHLYACLAFVAAGIVLVVVGLDSLALIPVIGCVAMMGAMVWMMGRGGSSKQ